MKYIGAYLLCVLGGNESPTSADVSKLLSSVGVEVEASMVDVVVKQMEGKTVDEMIAAGSQMFAAVPCGGGGGGSGSGGGDAAGASGGGGGDAPKEEAAPAEEEVEEEMDFDLFD